MHFAVLSTAAFVLLAFASGGAEAFLYSDSPRIRNGEAIVERCRAKLSESEIICSLTQSTWKSCTACIIAESRRYRDSEISDDQVIALDEDIDAIRDRVCVNGRRIDRPQTTTPSGRRITGRTTRGF